MVLKTSRMVDVATVVTLYLHTLLGIQKRVSVRYIDVRYIRYIVVRFILNLGTEYLLCNMQCNANIYVRRSSRKLSASTMNVLSRQSGGKFKPHPF